MEIFGLGRPTNLVTKRLPASPFALRVLSMGILTAWALALGGAVTLYEIYYEVREHK